MADKVQQCAEYFNELIVDEVMSIVPEWNKKYIQEPTVDKFDKYYHRYESLDFGVRDKTALLLAKYNFTTAQLIVEKTSGPAMAQKPLLKTLLRQ